MKGSFCVGRIARMLLEPLIGFSGNQEAGPVRPGGFPFVPSRRYLAYVVRKCQVRSKLGFFYRRRRARTDGVAANPQIVEKPFEFDAVEDSFAARHRLAAFGARRHVRAGVFQSIEGSRGRQPASGCVESFCCNVELFRSTFAPNATKSLHTRFSPGRLRKSHRRRQNVALSIRVSHRPGLAGDVTHDLRLGKAPTVGILSRPSPSRTMQ